MKTIQLTKGLTASVSDGDFERVAMYKWHASLGKIKKDGTTVYYARAWVKLGDEPTLQHVLLHRFVLGLQHSRIDHVNGDTLDCRRENLRPATNGQNIANQKQRNPTGFKGVKALAGGKFVAVISSDRGVRHIGTFAAPEQAARAYDAAAIERYGEHARPNFPTLVQESTK